MAQTKIEWATDVWNPVTGCSKVSPGCENCYAERISHRFGWTTKPWTAAHAAENVNLHTERLTEPLRWRKPRRVFVNSMSDLFHEVVPDWYIDQLFGIMMACWLKNKSSHTFIILTKRPDRMQSYLSPEPVNLIERWSKSLDGVVIMDDPDMLFSEYVETVSSYESIFPLPNVWLGVTVEDQRWADERIPLLLQTPAVVRFVSCEPLLGPVDLTRINLGQKLTQGYGSRRIEWDALTGWEKQYLPEATRPSVSISGPDRRINWVIVGGESGLGARPMHPDWVRDIRDQCREANVPFFFKQWGEWAPVHEHEPRIKGKLWFNFDPDTAVCRFGKKKAGRILDGRTWDEMPDIIT
ncbi:phage Gp37/Gp68 family protein [Effusibacillus pohliae]|uniref:phage Gp37/Gp68 family protein n=1 Tax=Effusibacillus pohliae TaxID=232270 RepID=UPI000477EE31|nr:phage Gp37/Gp68 family protein [Effusibacillus pohliae]